MSRIQDICITVAGGLVAFSAIAFNLGGFVAPDLVKVPQVSDLEARNLAASPEVSAEAISTGKFQSEFEAYLSDHVPQRDAAVVAHAGAQRASIAASAPLFGFDTYPTFFGSEYNVVPKDGIIANQVEAQPNPEMQKQLDAWIKTLNDAAAAHPDVRFSYDLVARHDQVAFNPTYQYLDGRLDAEWAQENMVDRLDPQVGTFLDEVTSLDEIKNDWMATDGHWTLERALQSYNRIAIRNGLEYRTYENPVKVVDAWHGDYARNGLDFDYPMPLMDAPDDFSNLHMYELGDLDGEEFVDGKRDEVLASGEPMKADLNSAYYDYFGGGSMEVLNDTDASGKSALVVTDSLSYCLHRYVADNFQHTTFILPGNTRMDKTLEEFIREYNPDYVLILTHLSKYQSFAEYSPKFLGLE